MFLQAIRGSVSMTGDIGRELTRAVYQSAHKQQGVAAFFEKRAARWTGR